MYTEKDVTGYAAYCGIYVATWSPGDGVTRYRFFRERKDYFQSEGIGHAMGAKAAMTFLHGYKAGRHEGMRLMIETSK